MRARVLIADDHRIVAEGLKGLLEPEYEVVGIVEDGAALVAAAEELGPDVIVADISMPLLGGLEAAREVKKHNEKINIIFLTMHPDIAYAVTAFDAGASAYLLKHSASTELLMAMNEVLRGRTYITPVIAGDLMRTYRSSTRRGHASHSLTPKQRTVLRLLGEGHPTKEVAAIMKISPRTVEFHKYRIMADLGIKNTAELIRYAIKNGIVSAS